MLPEGQMGIRLGDGRLVRAMVARTSRAFVGRLLPGDRVEIELFAFDPRRGSVLRKLP